MALTHYIEFENYPWPKDAGIIMTSILPLMDQDCPIEVLSINEEFRSDVKAATSKYYLKRFKVTGFIVEMGKDAHGLDSIQLSDEAGGYCRLLCVLKSASEYDGKKPGDKVVMEGNFMDCHPEYGVVLKMSVTV